MLDLAFLALILFIAIYEFFRSKQGKFDFLSLFNLVFILLYPLPAFVLAANLENARIKLGWSNRFYVDNWQTALAIFVGYFLVVIGFYSKSAINLGRNIRLLSRSDDRVLGCAVFLLLFSCFSIYMYGLQYGGVLIALEKAYLIRAGAVAESGSLVFFQNFMFFSFLGSYLLGAFLFIKRRKKRKLILATGFILSVILSWLAVALTAGRINFVKYLVGFYLVYVTKKEKFSWGFTIPFVYVTALFILYGKTLFFSLTALPDGFAAVADRFVKYSLKNNSGEVFSFIELIGNFAYPVFSLDTAFDTHYSMRLFLDWYYGLVTLIVPERLINIEIPNPVSYDNTIYTAQTDTFSIPPGFLAFGIYSLSWPGLVIVCFVYGWIGRYLQTILYKHIHDIFWMPFFYVLTAITWLDFQAAGDPALFLTANFWFLASSLLLLGMAVKFSLVRQHKS